MSHNKAWALAVLVALATPRVARAETRGAFVLHLEAGAGAVLSSYQRDALGYGLGLGGALRAGVRLAGALSLQAGAGYRAFPAEQGAGFAADFMGGVRVEPLRGSTTLFVDGNAGAVRTGPDWRFGYDVGVGLEFAAGRHLRLGPVLRFHHLMAASNDAPADALAAVVGLSLSLQRGAPPPPPPVVEFQGAEWAALAAGPRPTAQVSDRDGDGVYDHRDQCPDEAEGDHPDRARLGCPAGDRDGDGVLDPDDTCPDQAAGASADPERGGCPDGDDDGDGVVNQIDQCRAEAAGRAPDPQRAGCPAPDGDGDMVPDSVDACPREAGAPATRARDHGCPGMVTVREGQLRTRRPVLFAGEGDTLAPRSERVLEAVAEVLRLAPQVRRVRVEGHVDERDDAMALSERRASRVVTWLTAHGVDASRLESRGLGATRPVRPNTSRRNREHNCRVEFYLVEDAPSAPAASSAAPAAPPSPPAAPAAAPATPFEPAALPAPADTPAPEAGDEAAPEGRHGRHGRHHRRSRRHRH